MVAAAVIGGAALTAGVGAVSSNRAAKTQAGAANSAAQVQRQMYETTREDLAPYTAAGRQALNPLLSLASGNPADVMGILSALPGYQFARTQGLKGVQNGAAARGLGSSGAALKGAAGFATGLANQNFDSYFNKLLGVAQLGQNSAVQSGNFAMTTGQGIGNALIGAGNARAAGQLGVGNAINNAFGTAGNLYMTNGLLQQQGYPGFWGGTPGSSQSYMNNPIYNEGKIG